MSETRRPSFRVKRAMFEDVREVIFAWNVLPAMVEKTDTIMTFKSLLDMHTDMPGMEGYGSCAGRLH